MADVQSVVLFDGLPSVDGKQLVNDLSWRWPELGTPQHLVRGEHEVGFALEDAAVTLVNHRAPIDYSDFPERNVAEKLWPGALAALMAHQSHLVITVELHDRRTTDLFSIATKITASALSASTGGLGVYWPATPALINRTAYLEKVSVFPSLPLDLWVDIKVGRGRDGSVTASTSGLESFGLRELESVDSPESIEAARVRFTNLVSQVLRHRRNVSDGVVLGQDDKWKVAVEVGPSKLGRLGDVSAIVFEPTTNQAIIDAAVDART